MPCGPSVSLSLGSASSAGRTTSTIPSIAAAKTSGPGTMHKEEFGHLGEEHVRRGAECALPISTAPVDGRIREGRVDLERRRHRIDVGVGEPHDHERNEIAMPVLERHVERTSTFHFGDRRVGAAAHERAPDLGGADERAGTEQRDPCEGRRGEDVRICPRIEQRLRRRDVLPNAAMSWVKFMPGLHASGAGMPSDSPRSSRSHGSSDPTAARVSKMRLSRRYAARISGLTPLSSRAARALGS